jgi:transposase
VESIPKAKIRIIRSHFIGGVFNQSALAMQLGICRNTMLKFVNLFRRIERDHPEKLKDFSFFPPTVKKLPPPSEMLGELLLCLPELIMAAETRKLEHVPLWNAYRRMYPQGYSLSRFTWHFIAWRRKNSVCLYAHRAVKTIPDRDRTILLEWKSAGNHRKWRKAVVILGSKQGLLLDDLAKQIESNVRVAQRWIDAYKASGIAGLEKKPVDYSAIKAEVKQKQNNLMKLVHQAPILFDINRTTWRLEDLALIYHKVYRSKISEARIWDYLRMQGFVYRSAKRHLTSPDKKYRDKLEKIQQILGHLAPDEKFFSIDELGPFGIKVREGSLFMHPDNPKTVPAYQRSSAYLICTAALELSTNQVTHFYSPTKNTDEMIKLANLLLLQYRDQAKLYLSWDSAGWHSSKKLKEFLLTINAPDYRKQEGTPVLELVPLPVSAQFLNVIESVFCGLARSVLHNSNYKDEAECKAAIDRYFAERNLHYKEHPKRAGNKIWGKELVAPVFSAGNNCKEPGIR